MNSIALEITDEDLVFEIIRTNNKALFTMLYERFSNFVYNNCYSFSKNTQEAEDLKQDVFVMLFLKLKTFKGASKFSSWLYSFTYNFCVNYVQRDKEKRKERITDVTDTFIEESDIYEVDCAVLFELKANRLVKVFEKITVSEKTILLMKYQDDMSIKEISEVLNLSISAVKMRLKRTKEKVVKIHNELV